MTREELATFKTKIDAITEVDSVSENRLTAIASNILFAVLKDKSVEEKRKFILDLGNYLEAYND